MLEELATLGSERHEDDDGRTLPGSDESFPPQWGYVTCPASMVAVCCSRQCGKTVGARLRARRRACEKPGTKVLYITLVRRNCRKLFFHPLKEELAHAGWGYTANEVDMVIRLANGSRIEAVGCDDQAGLGKIRGDNYDLVIIDEAQEPAADVLERLVDQVLGPQFVTRGGTIDMLGTPPESMAGYFIDALPGGANAERWTFHGWSMFDAAAGGVQDLEKIQKAIKDRGIGPGHPVYEREYLGNHRVRDPSKTAYEYLPQRNDYAAFKREEHEEWRYSMGLDLGFQDRDAIVVLGWRRDDGERRLFEVYRWQEHHLDVDQLAVKVREVVREFRPVIVGDHGGHGAVKVLETLKNRMGILINPKPADVMASVGLVNDDFRSGRLLLEKGSPLGPELLKVTRTVNPRTKRLEINKAGFHSDLSEALRYAHHAARHFASKPPKPPETTIERRIRQEQERRRYLEDPYGD